jgi:hypothetical protein
LPDGLREHSPDRARRLSWITTRVGKCVLEPERVGYASRRRERDEIGAGLTEADESESALSALLQWVVASRSECCGDCHAEAVCEAEQAENAPNSVQSAEDQSHDNEHCCDGSVAEGHPLVSRISREGHADYLTPCGRSRWQLAGTNACRGLLRAAREDEPGLAHGIEHEHKAGCGVGPPPAPGGVEDERGKYGYG